MPSRRTSSSLSLQLHASTLVRSVPFPGPKLLLTEPLVYCKALDADVPANLHTLAFALHSCGKRWPLARQYETIIRTAVAEHRSPIAQCVLPVEFYDFRYSTLEITDLLQATAERLSR